MQLDKFDIQRLRKCEICGPVLLGLPGKYPVCKRHKETWKILSRT
jgi:hypothetical protein